VVNRHKGRSPAPEGAVMGQGVIWYTGQFYAQTFIENICKINFTESRNILMIAILFATPFFVVFGALSDKIGRKWIMLLGMLLGICTYFPIYKSFVKWTDPANKRELVDLSKTTVGPAIAYVDATDKKKMLVSTQYDTVYTDGAKFTYTKVDTIHFAATYAGNTAAIGYIAANKDNPATMDTVLVKTKVAAGAVLPEGVTYAIIETKSAKPGVVIEKHWITIPNGG